MKWPSATKTKRIPNLPPLPPKNKLLLTKEPTKKGTCTRAMLGLILTFENGSLIAVKNPKGSLPAVWIVQTVYPGFGVRVYDKPFSLLGYGYHKANQLAIRLALRGHKLVINY